MLKIRHTFLLMLPVFLFPVVNAQVITLNEIVKLDSQRIISSSDNYLMEKPVTITAFTCDRSSGGLHDYFSEGDYWWPDPVNPKSPYIRRDGMSNPGNFDDHRRVMVRMSILVPSLVAAFLITGDNKYSDHAIKHLKAWFINRDTRMNPSLNYAQAIQGRVKGRGVGIIDTIHLVEVARAVHILARENAINPEDLAGLKQWFTRYLNWMTTHEYGLDEMNRKNNHGTCWVMQVAAYAGITEQDSLQKEMVERVKTVLIPNQIANDGSFPLELERTKPYGYSLFNLDVFGIVCRLLSDFDDGLWYSTVSGSGSIGKAFEFMVPFIVDKNKWNLPPDVMYFDMYPVRHPGLLFAGIALGRPEYIELWKRLDPEPQAREVIRNFPVRQPVLWID